MWAWGSLPGQWLSLSILFLGGTPLWSVLKGNQKGNHSVGPKRGTPIHVKPPVVKGSS